MWNLTIADEGWYHCLITYMNRVPEDMPSPNGTWVFLSILSKPKLEYFSEPEVILKDGDRLSLFCKASGTPKPEIFWYRDGYLIAPGSSHVHVDGETLLILHVLSRDAGVYVCRAVNSVGEDKKSFKVVLEGGLYIANKTDNVTIAEGSKTACVCEARGSPDNITYKWTIKEDDADLVGTDVTTVEGLSKRYSVSRLEGKI